MWRWLLLGFLVACADGEVVDRSISSEALVLDREAGAFLHEGAPYSGWVEVRDDLGRRRERAGFRQGRRHGLRTIWSEDGVRLSEVPYVDGRREGRARSWWPTGALRTESHFRDDRPHGVQRQWYRSGALFKETHLVDGAEQGLQRAWRQNGSIYTNYEAIHGRTFGLRRAKPCFQLEEEDVASADDREPGPVPVGVR